MENSLSFGCSSADRTCKLFLLSCHSALGSWLCLHADEWVPNDLHQKFSFVINFQYAKRMANKIKCRLQSSRSSCEYNLRKMVSSYFAALFRCNKCNCCSPQGQLWDLQGLFIQTNEFFFLANFPSRSSDKKLWEGRNLLDTLPVLSLFLSWALVWC